jgi:very-short-patch-repair endonuclease
MEKVSELLDPIRVRSVGLRDRCAPAKKSFARKLRHNLTPSEDMLWQRLRGKALEVRIRRQAIIRGWIADFYCPSKGLIIEVDGSIHRSQKALDEYRDKQIFQDLGMRTLRFTNDEVMKNMDDVLRRIRTALDESDYRPKYIVEVMQ